MNYDSLQSSAEADEHVAAEVLGWSRMLARGGKHIGWNLPGGKSQQMLPAFTTNANAAIALILPEIQKICRYDVSLVFTSSGVVVAVGGPFGRNLAIADTVPLAICRAAIYCVRQHEEAENYRKGESE